MTELPELSDLNPDLSPLRNDRDSCVKEAPVINSMREYIAEFGDDFIHYQLITSPAQWLFVTF